jgi:hypothetical protein
LSLGLRFIPGVTFFIQVDLLIFPQKPKDLDHEDNEWHQEAKE